MSSDVFNDLLLQRVDAIEQRLKSIERAQRSSIVTITRQLEAFVQLHTLIGPIPGSLHGWPISADFGLCILQCLLDEPPELVIEYGSGTSTFLLLRGLAKAYPNCSGSYQGARSAPQLICYEHLPQYHELTSELIAPCKLRRHAQLLLSPLKPWRDASGTYDYYSKMEYITASVTALRRKRKHNLRRFSQL